LGFDYAESQIAAAITYLRGNGISAQRIRDDLPSKVEAGTVEHYAQYESALQWVHNIFKHTRRPCLANLTPQLVGAEGCRVEVIDSLGDRPRRFNVGKSTGWMPVHLEVHNRRSVGGVPASRAYYSVSVVSAS